MSDSEFPHTVERPPPSIPAPEGCNCCYSTTAAAIAVADAVAEASAGAMAFACAMVWIAVAIQVTIAIIVFAMAIAMALAFAQSIAAAWAVAVAVAAAIAIAVALAAALRATPVFQRLHRCTELIDLPSITTLANPLRPAVVWETVHPRGAHHVDVLASTDGGASFTPAKIDATAEARNLPITGSFVWNGIALIAAGTVVLVCAIAYDAGGREVCRSRTRNIRVLP